MRGPLILLSLATTVAAAILLVHVLTRDPGTMRDPVPDLSPPPETVAVRVGVEGDLEVVMAPLHVSPRREAFVQERWGHFLGAADVPRLVRIWVANHGEAPVRLPAKFSDAFSSPGDPALEFLSVDQLLAGAETPPPAFFEAVARTRGTPREVVGPGEVAPVVLAVSSGTTVDSLAGALFRSPQPIELKPARIRASDLIRWERRPQGRFAAMVIYDEDRAAADESASRRK